MRLPTLLLPALCALAVVGCGDGQDDRESGPDPHLLIRQDHLQGDSDTNVDILFTGLAWNAGDRPAYVFNDCCGLRPEVEILDPSGTVVRDNRCYLRCVGRPDSLEAEPAMGVVSFDGFVWGGEGWIPAPPGRYEARARLTWSERPGGATRTLERSLNFDWGFR